MCSTCKKFTTTRWLLLGVLLLAVIAFTGQTAYGAVCAGTEIVSASGGLTLGQPGGIHAGVSYTSGQSVITNTSTCDGSGENVTMGGTVILVPACTVVPLAGTTCGSPDNGVITITSATSAINACGGNAAVINWTVTGGPGTFTLTDPNGNVPLAAFGQCVINFSYTVNTLPTVDAKPVTGSVLDTGGSAAASVVADSGDSAGGVGTTSTPFLFTCAVKVDKQISCDGGATWQDAGLESANNDSSNGCIGKVGVAGAAGTAGIAVQYQAQNISDSGIAVTSCTIGESNVSLGPGVTATFGIGNNGSGGGAGNQTTALIGSTAASPVECLAATPGSEPNTGTLTCTCNVPLAVQPTVTATDSATFGCCGVAIDKQISCDNAATWVDALNSAGDPSFQTKLPGDGQGSCTAIDGLPVDIRYFMKNTGTVALTCTPASPSDLTQGLNDVYIAGGGVAFTPTAESIAVGGTVGPVDNNTTCSDALNTNESQGDRATIGCTCLGAAVNGANVTVMAQDEAKVQCQSIGATASKQCIPTGDTTFKSEVKVTNTGTVDLTCTVVDAFTTSGPCGQTAPDCSAALPGTAVAMSSPVSVTGSPANCSGATCNFTNSTSNADFTSTTTACNAACVTCTPTAGGTALAPIGTQSTCNPCSATLDKQVSCDGGTTWHSTGPNSADTCQGVQNATDIQIKYIATNNGSSDLVQCTLLDSNAGITGFDAAPGGGTGSITVSSSATTTSSVLACTTTLTSAEPDTATLHCTCGSPTSGITVTATDTATFSCPGGTCFARTPGYWGTHPNQTQTVLNLFGTAGMPSCGVNLTNTTAGINQSAIEDLCATGTDYKAYNTSSSESNMLFQCAAAALNLAASAQANLNCDGAVAGGITTAFNACCGAGGTCDNGSSGATIASDPNCLKVAAFNAMFETSAFPTFLPNESANPTQCQIARNNNFLDTCSASSAPPTPACGSGRIYGPKK